MVVEDLYGTGIEWAREELGKGKRNMDEMQEQLKGLAEE